MSTTEPVMPGDDSYAEDLKPLSALNTTIPVKTEEAPQSLEPPSEYDLLAKQVVDTPHDHDAWRRFIDVAEDTGDIDKISAAYDALLKQFPNTVCLPPVDTPV